MNRTNISWCDYTSNPLRARNRETGKAGHFCERVSPGCAHCYASEWNEHRYGTGVSFLPANRDLVEPYLVEAELREWQKPKYRGAKVFIEDMSDVFAPWVSDEWLDRIFASMALAPEVTFQLLTKRPERMRHYMVALMDRLQIGAPSFVKVHSDIFEATDGGLNPLPNVWLGVSAENQRWADERIPILLDTPAAVRFVSVEPMLGPVDLDSPWPDTVHSRDFAAQLDWVICGGESGACRRPFDVDWARSVRDQCAAAGVAFWFKQLGAAHSEAYAAAPDDLKIRQFPETR